jgi:hypothetical protein
MYKKNCASRWNYFHDYTRMHGQLNIKFDFFQLVTYFSPDFLFYQTLSLYISFDMLQNSHIYAPILLTLYPFFKDKNRQYSLQANARSGGGLGLFTLSESRRHPPGLDCFHHVSHSRTTTETMRPSSQFEQQLLITHGKMFTEHRRSVTESVNWPLPFL